jgi:hypothetical protein
MAPRPGSTASWRFAEERAFRELVEERRDGERLGRPLATPAAARCARTIWFERRLRAAPRSGA